MVVRDTAHIGPIYRNDIGPTADKYIGMISSISCMEIIGPTSV